MTLKEYYKQKLSESLLNEVTSYTDLATTNNYSNDKSR